MPAPRHFVYTILPSPGDSPDVEVRVEPLAAATGMLAYDARQLLLRGGVVRIPVPTEGDGAAETARKLRNLDYTTCLLEEADLCSIPRPQRVVQLGRVDENGVDLCNRPGPMATNGRSEGTPVLRIVRNKRLLLVIGDILDSTTAHPASPSLNRSSTSTERMMTTGQGRPALLVWIEGNPQGVLILGQAFNYASMGPEAGPSSSLNFRRLVQILSNAAGDARVDTSFGRLDIPAFHFGWTVTDDSPSEKLMAHGALVRGLWERGLDPSTSTPSATEGSIAPDPAEEAVEPNPAPGHVSGGEADDPTRAFTSLGRFLGELRRIGPLRWVVPPFTLAVVTGILGVYLDIPGMVPPAAALVAILFLLWGRSCGRRRKVLVDHPVVLVRSIREGPVVVEGQVVGRMPFKTPFSETACVWFESRIDRLVETERRKRWTVASRSGSGEYPFYVDDGTGRVLVDPRGALFDVWNEQTFSVNPALLKRGLPSSLQARGFRYWERSLPTGTHVLVMGTARGRKSADIHARLLQRLRDLKRDPARLTAFDQDGNGMIDADEWQAAVRATEEALRQEPISNGGDDEERVVIGAGEAADLFVVSDRERHWHMDTLGARMWIGYGTGGAVLVGSVVEVLRMFLAS